VDLHCQLPPHGTNQGIQVDLVDADQAADYHSGHQRKGIQSMTPTYCNGWFRHQKRAVTILDETTARQAHERRRPYTVVLGDLRAPNCFIEIDNDYVGVGFLDDLLREYLSYTFDESRVATSIGPIACVDSWPARSRKCYSGY
jgi:hypothetical protein